MAVDELSLDYRLSQMEKQIAILKQENEMFRKKQTRTLHVTVKLIRDIRKHSKTLKSHDESLVFLLRRTGEVFRSLYPKQGKLYAEMRQILKMGDDQIDVL